MVAEIKEMLPEANATSKGDLIWRLTLAMVLMSCSMPFRDR